MKVWDECNYTRAHLTLSVSEGETLGGGSVGLEVRMKGEIIPDRRAELH